VQNKLPRRSKNKTPTEPNKAIVYSEKRAFANYDANGIQVFLAAVMGT